MNRACFIVLTLGCLVACDDKKTDTKPAASASASATVAPQTVASATAVTTASAAPSSSAVAAADEPPTEFDFTDEAEASVNKDNMEAELAKLEKAIDAK